jgi:DEAD/DEAH box helicase domain-containing protein
VQQIIEYCQQDVAVTRDVFLHGLNKGYIEIAKADESKARFNVTWS